MRAHERKVAVLVLVLVAAWGSCAWADVAVTVDPTYPGFSPLVVVGGVGDPWVTAGRVYGWRFFVDKPLIISHLGLFAMQRDASGTLVDTSLSTTHTIALWRLPKEGGFDLRCVVTIGPEAPIEGHFAYVPLAEPLTIMPDTVPSPTGNLERWLLGVWTGTGNADLLYHGPLAAATFNAVQTGAIRLQSHMYYYKFVNYEQIYTSSVLTPPWGGAINDGFHYFALNAKYELIGPKAEAGPDVSIYSSEQAVTTINGLGTHTIAGTPIQYRWLEAGTVLQDWTAVGPDGAASLSLAAPVPGFSLGNHTLTLEVKDATDTASDEMTLSVSNSPPDGQPTPTYQVLEVGVDAIIIGASVADFDGDTVSYQWVKDGVVLDSGTATPSAGGTPAEILDLTIPAGDSRFPLGTNVVQLVISDGVNPAVTQEVSMLIQDTIAPTVAPTPSVTMLWPPNRDLVPVTIWANAVHNIGGTLDLAASVVSNEPDDGFSDQDWFVDAIDSEAGTISLRLRAERSGSGDGRVYTVTATGTDASGNASSATVDIRVPHARRKM